MNDNLAYYYSQRAKEYEKTYDRPERLEDIGKLKELFRQLFSGHRVLEIACGTGYWTQVIAESAQSITAIDINREVLDLAESKDYGRCEVAFMISDAYSLAEVRGYHSAGFCGFWWSHIPKKRMEDFIIGFHSRLENNALVAILDNKYIEGSSIPIARRDQNNNTYQIRRLEDGTSHEVLKNFPTARELEESLSAYCSEMNHIGLDYYWVTTYRTSKSPESA